jgi:hypothetical protein
LQGVGAFAEIVEVSAADQPEVVHWLAAFGAVGMVGVLDPLWLAAERGAACVPALAGYGVGRCVEVPGALGCVVASVDGFAMATSTRFPFAAGDAVAATCSLAATVQAVGKRLNAGACTRSSAPPPPGTGW